MAECCSETPAADADFTNANRIQTCDDWFRNLENTWRPSENCDYSPAQLLIWNQKLKFKPKCAFSN